MEWKGKEKGDVGHCGPASEKGNGGRRTSFWPLLPVDLMTWTRSGPPSSRKLAGWQV